MVCNNLESNDDSARHGLKKIIGSIQRKVKVNFALIIGRKASRNAKNDPSQPAN